MKLTQKIGRMFPKKFLTQMAGAATVGAVEAVLENFSPMLFGQPTKTSNTNRPLLGIEPLVPVETWMVLPIGGLIAFATRKSPKLKAFGDGALLYAVPRIVSREIVRTEEASKRNWSPIT